MNKDCYSRRKRKGCSHEGVEIEKCHVRPSNVSPGREHTQPLPPKPLFLIDSPLSCTYPGRADRDIDQKQLHVVAATTNNKQHQHKVNLRSGTVVCCLLAGLAGTSSFLYYYQKEDTTDLLRTTLWGGVETQNDPMRLHSAYIPWSNETKDDILRIAMNKYIATSTDELDLPNAIGIGGVLNMEDPMGGRNWKCLAKFFQNWTDITEDIPRYPLFQSFFEWLDFGDGRDVEVIPECTKEDFNHHRYWKFTATERAETEVQFKVYGDRRAHVRFVKSKSFVHNGTWQFVWGIDRKVYILDEKERDDRRRGHASFFCGRPVLFAGEIGIGIGSRIAWISDKSGHYKPTLPFMRNFAKYLEDEGVNIKTFIWRVRGKLLNPSELRADH